MTSRWIDALHASSIVTTEVSQLPLSGALAVLETGSENGALGVVDVDVSPETACGREASLGTWDELLNVLTAANVVKMSKQVALDVLSGMRRQTNNGSSTSELCHSLQQALAVDLVLITDGAAGSVGVFDDSSAVHCEPGLVANVRDTTGAGVRVVKALTLNFTILWMQSFLALTNSLMLVIHIPGCVSRGCCSLAESSR